MSLSVMIKMLGEAEDSVVQSITMVGNTRHKRGVVSARIILGDIVTNMGVIHLIDTPLVLMTQTLSEIFSADSSSLMYSSFLNSINPNSSIMKQMINAQNVTVLVPTNAAIENASADLSDEIIEHHFLNTLVLEADLQDSNETSVSFRQFPLDCSKFLP